MDSKVAYFTEHIQCDLLYLQHESIKGGENAGLKRELATLVKSTDPCEDVWLLQGFRIVSCIAQVHGSILMIDWDAKTKYT